ncbi:serine/threonine-protein kinase [Chondromyces apiculatus]|uniref:Serine/threonine protein kinase n=1 Tax=Chondromyces apiculatus DSM 436 TaxID=1192034 RepID=A0A017TEN9_9BACT|nr:serine/threonine-protein kinase [Chondromyces apiculatus]EYF07295.1 serine/threonine protein kinase [Chondromyces apiculatus DSM 436]
MTSSSPELETSVARRAQARVGQILREKWRLDSLIGVGGMAAVYKASHRNGMRGAVKMLHLEFSANDDVRQRFLREGYVANRVDHPGAVRVLDDDVAEDGSVFLVMELLEGATLDRMAMMRQEGRLGVDEVLTMSDALLGLLVVAHSKGIVHRDLKPENLFLTMAGELKVLDFGIARVREVQASGRETREGSLMGTPAFMPPEQAMGSWSEVDGRTDLWAAGATMFSLLTGRLVHDGDTAQKLLLASMTKQAPPLGQVAPGMPLEVCAVVDRALAFARDQRWPDASAMQQAVRHAREVRARASSPVLSVPQFGVMPSPSVPSASVPAPSGPMQSGPMQSSPGELVRTPSGPGDRAALPSVPGPLMPGSSTPAPLVAGVVQGPGALRPLQGASIAAVGISARSNDLGGTTSPRRGRSAIAVGIVVGALSCLALAAVFGTRMLGSSDGGEETSQSGSVAPVSETAPGAPGGAVTPVGEPATSVSVSPAGAALVGSPPPESTVSAAATPEGTTPGSVAPSVKASGKPPEPRPAAPGTTARPPTTSKPAEPPPATTTRPKAGFDGRF